MYRTGIPDVNNPIATDLQYMRENFDAIYKLFTNIFKNRIINGDFAIWQRGTSATVSAFFSGYDTADRWKLWVNDGVFDTQLSNMNSFNSKKVIVNTVPTTTTADIIGPFWYMFEGQHLYDLAIQGKTVTLSFWFRSNVTGVYSVAFRNRTGGNDESYVTEFNYTTANTPQKIIIQIPLNSSFTALANDNNIGFDLVIAGFGYTTVTSNLNTWLTGNYWISSNAVNWTSAVGNYVEITQVQLEEGNVATEFEYVPYDVQLLRCMRYYYNSMFPHFDVASLEGAMTSHAYSSVDFFERYYHLPVPMRAKPTVRTIAYSSGTVGAYRNRTTNTDVTGVGLAGETCSRALYWLAAGTLTTGNLYTWHFTADAEL